MTLKLIPFETGLDGEGVTYVNPEHVTKVVKDGVCVVYIHLVNAPPVVIQAWENVTEGQLITDVVRKLTEAE